MEGQRSEERRWLELTRCEIHAPLPRLGDHLSDLRRLVLYVLPAVHDCEERVHEFPFSRRSRQQAHETGWVQRGLLAHRQKGRGELLPCTGLFDATIEGWQVW